MPKSDLRQHQQQVYAAAQKIKHSRKPNADIFTEVVPGGGKSRNVSILARALQQSSMASGVVWITPRRSLQAQAVESAAAGPGGGLPGFQIGEDCYSPTAQGFATNFASLLRNPKQHLEALKAVKGPVLLVADEIHFLRGGREVEGWSEAFAALRKEVFDRGGHQLSMTGTARRWDENPVVNTPYDPRYRVLLDSSRVIRYDREDGLKDEAIVRIQPQYFDGPVQWREPDGTIAREPRLLSEFGMTSDLRDASLLGRSLRTFLSRVNLHSVHVAAVWDALTRPKQGWLRYRTIYGNNQLIIAVDRQSTATALTNVLNSPEFRARLRSHSKHLGFPFADDFRAVLAVSSDAHSCSAITSYRIGHLDSDCGPRKISDAFSLSEIGQAGDQVHCLVTVGMASVGMDAPACTHMVNLGAIRSIPWLCQLFARAWRAGDYDWPTGRAPLPVRERRAFIWMPADARMRLAFEAVCRGAYAAGCAKKQLQDLWPLLPDPAEDSDGLEELANRPPRPKTPGVKNPRPLYHPVPGISRLSHISVECCA